MKKYVDRQTLLDAFHMTKDKAQDPSLWPEWLRDRISDTPCDYNSSNNMVYKSPRTGEYFMDGRDGRKVFIKDEPMIILNYWRRMFALDLEKFQSMFTPVETLEK